MLCQDENSRQLSSISYSEEDEGEKLNVGDEVQTLDRSVLTDI